MTTVKTYAQRALLFVSPFTALALTVIVMGAKRW